MNIKVSANITYNNVGICAGAVQSIKNAEVFGSGNFQGDMRYYVCSGDYMWNDLKLENQAIICQEDGSWSNNISSTCKRVF